MGDIDLPDPSRFDDAPHFIGELEERILPSNAPQGKMLQDLVGGNPIEHRVPEGKAPQEARLDVHRGSAVEIQSDVPILLVPATEVKLHGGPKSAKIWT